MFYLDRTPTYNERDTDPACIEGGVVINTDADAVIEGREVYLRAGADCDGVYLTRDEATKVFNELGEHLNNLPALPIPEPVGVIAAMDCDGDIWRRYEDGHYDLPRTNDYLDPNDGCLSIENFDALVRVYGPIVPLFANESVAISA